MHDEDDKQGGWLQHLKGWPIVGRLWEVPPEAIKEARSEVASATFYSTMPFWLPPIIGSIIFLERPSLWSGISGGELFVYAAALVGPLAYIITKRYGRFEVPDGIDESGTQRQLTYPFPYGRASFYIAAFLCILSGIVFTIQRVSSLEQFRQTPFINENGLVWLSILIAFGSTILLFCIIAYRNMLELLERKHSDKISGAQKRDEDSFAAQWEARKERS